MRVCVSHHNTFPLHGYYTANITYWMDTLSSQSLKQLTVDGLLNRHLLLSLNNSPTHLSLVGKAER